MAWNETKKYKNFMAKLYGWGAALVIIGADFSKQRTYFQEVFHKVKKAKHPVSTGCFYMG